MAKNRMNMFKPLTEEDRSQTRVMLDAIHEHFQDVVRSGRGARLKKPEAELFTGDYWTGDVAFDYGLADRLCNLQDVLVKEYRVPDAKDYTPRPTIYEALSSAIGTQIASHFGSTATGSAGPMLLPPRWPGTGPGAYAPSVRPSVGPSGISVSKETPEAYN
ncbi:MAG: S49 family peptidase [Steroidobacteraceae bacterium]